MPPKSAAPAAEEVEPDVEPDTDEEEAVEAGELGDDPDADFPDEPEDAPGFNPDTFEKENNRHASELKDLFGDSWDGMKPCDTCGGVGHVPSDFVEPPEVLHDPDLVACAACNTYGIRLTPSSNEQYATTPCTKCQGRGYRGKDEVEAERQAAQYQLQAATPIPAQPEVIWNPQENKWDVVQPPPPGYVPPVPAPQS